MESFLLGFFFPQSQMICHRGYPSEEYEVLTRDGYYIRLNRIPHGRENPRNRGTTLFHKEASKEKKLLTIQEGEGMSLIRLGEYLLLKQKY